MSSPLSPMAHAAPPTFKVSSNIGKERGSQPQHGHSISQPQHSQSESGGIVPNQQHRTDPLITRETGLSSPGHAATVGVPPFQPFRPVIAYVPVHTDEVNNPERSPPLPPYEPGPPTVPVTQEGAPSRSGAKIPSDARDEPKKLPGKMYPSSLCHLKLTGGITCVESATPWRRPRSRPWVRPVENVGRERTTRAERAWPTGAGTIQTISTKSGRDTTKTSHTTTHNT